MSQTLWQLYDSDTTFGTCKVVSDEAGACTLTVDKIAGSDLLIVTQSRLKMGAQGTGVTTSTAGPFGLELHAKNTASITKGDTGLTCGLRCRYEVGADQTTQISYEAIDARLRVKKDLADGTHCGICGVIEASESGTVLGGTSTTTRAGGLFALDFDANVSITSGFLCGVIIDSSVNGSVSMASCDFIGLYIKTGASKEVWESGITIADASATTGITLGTCTTGISIGVCTTAISAVNPINVAVAQTSATPGTSRAIYGKNTSHTSMTSGNLVGVRGEVTVGGSVSTGVYLYGAQGKLIGGANTITAGNGMVCGVYGQIDVTGTTLASGWIAAIHADIYGAGSGSYAMNLISGTHAGGGVINSLLSLYGKSTYVFDLTSNTHTQMGTTGTVTTNAGYLTVLVDGSVRYIGLGSTVA